MFFFIQLGRIDYFMYICAQILNIVWQIINNCKRNEMQEKVVPKVSGPQIIISETFI